MSESSASPPDDDFATPLSPAPRGKLKDESARVLDAIIRARLSGAVKDILLVLYHRTYTMRLDDPQWGWVRADRQELADQFHTTKSDIQERLNRLKSLHIIQGDRSTYARLASLRDPNDWNAAIFDWEVARATHTRPGAGAPPVRRDREPAWVPVEEREGDRRARAFMTLEYVTEHCLEKGLDDGAVEIHWRVVDYFQRTFDDTFPGKFLNNLTDLLTEHTSASLIATLGEIRATRNASAPMGYLITTLANAKREQQRRQERTEGTPNVRTPTARRRTNNRMGASSDVIDAGATIARSKILYDDEDESDDADLGRDLDRTETTTAKS
jgi:hypothetical protein